MTASTDYAEISKRVDALIVSFGRVINPTIVAYQIIRAALLYVRGREGGREAAAMAYRLADEFAAEKIHD